MRKVFKKQVSGDWIIALQGILETVVTFHFIGSKDGIPVGLSILCMCNHCTVQIYLTWLDVYIYMLRSHFHFFKRMLGKSQPRTA